MSVCLVIHAQTSPNFLVVSVQGNGYYTRDKYNIPLKIGSALTLSDKIVLGKQSTVSIICNNYNLFSIANKQSAKSQPTFLRNFSDSCKAPESGITTQFLKYLWQHLQEDVAVNEPDKTNIKEFGAVERGCPDPAFNSLRDTINVYHHSFTIQYHTTDTSARIQFVIVDDQLTDTLYKSAVHNNRIHITDSLIHLMNKEKAYKWTIIRNGMAMCDYKTIQKLTTTGYNNIISGIHEKNFNTLTKNDQYRALAFILNEKNVPGEALYYFKMIKPDKEDILSKIISRDLIKEFLY